VKVQSEKFRAGQSIYLNVLQALNDWGNAITSEAAALLNYNIALANLERRTGTILGTHGLVFHEERFRAAGPFLHPRLYPPPCRRRERRRIIPIAAAPARIRSISIPRSSEDTAAEDAATSSTRATAGTLHRAVAAEDIAGVLVFSSR